MTDDRHHQWMSLAERLADTQTGRTGENPSVGCVIVKNGIVIGRGTTADGGRPHAEILALGQAGGEARGATAYVTLEPCAHHGQTPPCADALIEAGIARLVCAWRDPNPEVNQQGFARIEAAGIEVIGLKRPLYDGLRGFFSRQLLDRPMVTLKLATSLDGQIALSNGESQWISGEIARRYTRAMRARFDGIGVGIGTVLADDPALTTRHDGLKNPRPVIFDQNGRLPQNAKILQGARALVISPLKMQHPNADWVEADPHDVSQALRKLAKTGINALLIEGGAELAASFIKAGVVDRIDHVATGAIMGGDAKAAIGALGLENMDAIARFSCTRRIPLGDDSLIRYECNHLPLADLWGSNHRR